MHKNSATQLYTHGIGIEQKSKNTFEFCINLVQLTFLYGFKAINVFENRNKYTIYLTLYCKFLSFYFLFNVLTFPFKSLALCNRIAFYHSQNLHKLHIFRHKHYKTKERVAPRKGGRGHALAEFNSSFFVYLICI